MELDFLEELIDTPEVVDDEAFLVKLYKVPEQTGPVRFFDATLRCTSRGCSSPTHFKLQGIPYCMIHLIWKMNSMMLAMGIEK